jgi:histidinol-phosphate aminotransferase
MEALGSIQFPYVYPDPESRRLREALAQDSGLESEYILVGCGADELIDLIMRLEPFHHLTFFIAFKLIFSLC